jgi:hypothetical protein
VGRICNTDEKKRMHVGNWWESQMERDVGWCIILYIKMHFREIRMDLKRLE